MKCIKNHIQVLDYVEISKTFLRQRQSIFVRERRDPSLSRDLIAVTDRTAGNAKVPLAHEGKK